MIERKNYFIGVFIGGEIFLDEPYTGTLRGAKRACVKYYGEGIYRDNMVRLLIVSEDYHIVAVRSQYHTWLNVENHKYDKMIKEQYGAYKYDFKSKAEHAWFKVGS